MLLFQVFFFSYHIFLVLEYPFFRPIYIKNIPKKGPHPLRHFISIALPLLLAYSQRIYILGFASFQENILSREVSILHLILLRCRVFILSKLKAAENVTLDHSSAEIMRFVSSCCEYCPLQCRWTSSLYFLFVSLELLLCDGRTFFSNSTCSSMRYFNLL